MDQCIFWIQVVQDSVRITLYGCCKHDNLEKFTCLSQTLSGSLSNVETSIYFAIGSLDVTKYICFGGIFISMCTVDESLV